MKRFYTLLISLVAFVSSMIAADITLYYVNSTGWSNVYAYVWDNATQTNITSYPGKKATKTTLKHNGYFIYSFTFDSSKADRIIFNNGGTTTSDKTLDLVVNASKPYFYDGIWYKDNTFKNKYTATLYKVVEDPCDVSVPSVICLYNSEEHEVNQFVGYVKSNTVEPSMTIKGKPVHKIVVPFDEPVYVRVRFNNVYCGTHKELIASNITLYSSSKEGESWYKSLDGARYGVHLADLNQQPETGKIYLIATSSPKVFSSKYGTSSSYSPSGTSYEETINGERYYSYEIDANLYDKVIISNQEYTINWSKPYFYNGQWYARLNEIPINKTLIEYCYTWDSNVTDKLLCLGNNIFKEEGYHQEKIKINNEDLTYSFYYCDKKISKTLKAPVQSGLYDVVVTLNANTEEITAEWELVTTGVKVKLNNEFSFASMDLVGENLHTYSYSKFFEPGLYYYTIKDEYNSVTKKDVVFEIPEKGKYDLLWTYNATTGKVDLEIKKVASEVTLYYVNKTDWSVVNAYVWDFATGTPIVAWSGEPATRLGKTVDGNEVYSYTFDSSLADRIIFNNGNGGAGNQTDNLTFEASKPYFYDGVWYETLTFDATGGDEGGNEGGEAGGDDTDPIVPETPAYVVRGNGGSDATGIWCGGIEWGYGDSPVNNMADTDKDGIYEVTYKNVPAGTWNFKVVGATEGWMGSDYLDTENSSADYTTAPNDGNIGFTLNAPADVTIKFNTLTGKIIATTPSGSFGKVKIDYFSVANTDECLVENRFTAANNNTLKYTENIQILEGNEYGYAGYRIVGNCNYAVYENSLIVEVTEAGIYDITIVFNGDYDNPDFSVQAEKVETPVVPPVNPDPVYSEIWLYGQVTGYQRLDEWKFTSNDGDNYVIDFATPTELTSLFYLFGKGDEPIVENPGGEPIYIFAADAITNIEANKTYTLVGNGSNAIGVQGIIETTRIEFQLSTATFKVIGTSKAKVFDVTKDYNLCINFNPAYPMTFKGNGVYTGTYVVSADATGYKTAFNFGDVNDAVVAMGSTDPLLYNVAIPLSTTYKNLVTQHLCYAGDTFEFTLTFKSDWTASVVVSYIPNLEGRTYTVRGNGSSDPSGVWCGGIEWADDNSPVNIMTDADKDGIYQVTYKNVPAGSYAFKVVGSVESWMGSDYLDTENSSAGYTTAPYDGNIGFTLNAPADVTIKFNMLTGKIIVTTPSGSFGKVKIDYFAVANGDECYVENIFTAANNNTLKYTEDIQILEGNEYGYAGYRILGNCNYAVYEKSLVAEVTESGMYEITIKFNGDYENPDFTVTAVKQGGTIDPTPDPDPVVAIKNLMIQPFEQILPNTTTTTVATFTLQNANTATVSIEGLDADFFEIGEQNIANGECSVSIVFKPIVRGVYYATLVVTTDDEVSLSIDFAAAAGDETFEPGDVPELNPDPVNPGTPDDEVSVEEVSAVMIYAKEGTIYSEVEFEIYDLAGVNVTKLNGSLQGVYIVKTAEGNRLVSVW